METVTLTKQDLQELLVSASEKGALNAIDMLGVAKTTVCMREAGRIFGRYKVDKLLKERKIKSRLVGRFVMVDLNDIRTHLKPL